MFRQNNGVKVMVMKILSLIKSPRKGGNTDILTDTLLKGIVPGAYACGKIFEVYYSFFFFNSPS